LKNGFDEKKFFFFLVSLFDVRKTHTHTHTQPNIGRTIPMYNSRAWSSSHKRRRRRRRRAKRNVSGL